MNTALIRRTRVDRSALIAELLIIGFLLLFTTAVIFGGESNVPVEPSPIGTGPDLLSIIEQEPIASGQHLACPSLASR